MSMLHRSKGANYRVWCPDRGSTKEDGRLFRSYSPEGAATQWAQWDDASSADYTIVGGSPADVVVAEDADGATEHRFTVWGESSPTYFARPTAQQGGQP